MALRQGGIYQRVVDRRLAGDEALQVIYQRLANAVVGLMGAAGAVA